MLPVCKFGSACGGVKSMRMSVKSRPSGCVRFSNAFEVLNDLQLFPECDLGSEVTPVEDVSLVERDLGV